jgi:hypothetical protein
LPVFVVGHRRDAGGLFLQQQFDAGALPQYGDVGVRATRRKAELRHPGEERVFIAGEPDGDRLALEIGRAADAAVAPASQLEPRALKDLRDVDDRRALVAGGERRGHPVGRDIGLAGGEHLRRVDIRPARQDRYLQTGLAIKPLVARHVIAGELRLRQPFRLQYQLVRSIRGAG